MRNLLGIIEHLEQMADDFMGYGGDEYALGIRAAAEEIKKEAGRMGKKVKKIFGTAYSAETGKYTPKEFTVAVEYDKEGKCLSINDGVRKWTVLASDVKFLLD